MVLKLGLLNISPVFIINLFPFNLSGRQSILR